MDEVARLLNRDGRAIISEFTKEGMDIIDRIHASEGRTHEHSASGVGLDDVEEYFTRKHFRIERKANAFQQVLVMYK